MGLFSCLETSKFKPHKPFYDLNNKRKCTFLKRSEDTLLVTHTNFKALIHELICLLNKLAKKNEMDEENKHTRENFLIEE